LFVFIAVVVVIVQQFTGSSSRRLRRLEEISSITPEAIVDVLFDNVML
jgi:hypothetical protein